MSLATIAPGVRVEVVNGMAKGRVGVIREPWPKPWADDVPLWRVRFTGELIRDRILREDFLRVVP